MTMLRAACLLLLILLPANAQKKLTYHVEYSSKSFGRLHVIIQPAEPVKGPATLIIPRAIPSGYAQQFYDRYVENVQATNAAGTAVKIEREVGPRWRIGGANTNVASVKYDVDLVRLEGEVKDASAASKARPNYVGLIGYTVLGYLEGFDNLPVRLEARGPEGWPIFTTLEPKSPADKSETSAEAKNFYALADSELAMGPMVQVRQLHTAVSLFLVCYTEVETDLDKHAQVFADAFRKVLDYFGEPPFNHYTAYIEFLKPVSSQHEYGFSMEHLDSSTYFLGADRAITSSTPALELERDRFNFAHHISHSWIPKRVYGTGYLPFTWELAPLIDTIWFNEGFARYVAIEALADAMPEVEARGYRQRQLDFLRKTVQAMPEFIRNMGLTELSRIGSTMYASDFRTGQTLFCKGALMAAEMDQRIRVWNKGKSRLRDSLRYLVKWSEESGRAFRTDELPALIAKPVGIPSREIQAIMQKWLAGTEPQ